MALPQPADIARQIPSIIARAGGIVQLLELEQTVTGQLWPQVEAERGPDGLPYLKQCFHDAVTIAVQRKLITSSGTKIFLADAGWEVASIAGSQPQGAGEESTPVIIDMSEALPEIEYRFNSGKLIRGHLRPGVQEQFHGKPMNLRPRRLVDALYSAEVDGEAVEMGFGTALKINKSGVYFPDLLQQKARVKLIGFQRGRTANGAAEPRVRRRGRRPGATWPTIVCGVIYEHGGFADWPSIASAIEQRPESEADVAWREEVMQVLRNHAAPKGRAYFEAVEADGRPVYALTDSGRKLALRHSQDDRAPTLSKYLVRAVSHEEDENNLTNMELYALLFLATRLGRAKEARAIYHKLPEDFPDEDSYAMIRVWIDEAEREQVEED